MRRLINQARRLRTEAALARSCNRHYAFVGMGGHSMANLYPVLNLLHVPLKYICVTSSRKVKLIDSNPGFKHVVATTSLGMVLDDPEVAAVFVSATPAAHYRIATTVLQHGKALFIERPPCQNLLQLESLINLQKQVGSYVQVGMQKRYAPAIRRLKTRLKGDTVYNYTMRYCVGHYPEGDAFTDLFIHPIDMVIHLFGAAEVVSMRFVAEHTVVLMLAHGDVVGTVELSTGYSWATPVESMTVHTRSGVYALPSIDVLTFQPVEVSLAGIPWEKMRHCNGSVEYLCRHDSFSPILESSTLVEHGFYHELKYFVDKVEDRVSVWHRIPLNTCPTLQSLLPVYQIIDTCLQQL